MKKKIIALGSIFVLVLGIFIFKNFYVKDKDEKNNNTITENKSKDTDSKKESTNKEDSNKNKESSKNNNSDEKITLESLKSQKKVMVLDFSQNG